MGKRPCWAHLPGPRPGSQKVSTSTNNQLTYFRGLLIDCTVIRPVICQLHSCAFQKYICSQGIQLTFIEQKNRQISTHISPPLLSSESTWAPDEPGSGKDEEGDFGIDKLFFSHCVQMLQVLPTASLGAGKEKWQWSKSVTTDETSEETERGSGTLNEQERGMRCYNSSKESTTDVKTGTALTSNHWSFPQIMGARYLSTNLWILSDMNERLENKGNKSKNH